MLVDQHHQISGSHAVERVIRFNRPAFLVRSSEDFRSVVRGACGFSGGSFCHLIPARNGQLAEVWSSYIQRLSPDHAYIPASLVDLKPHLQKLITGSVIDVDYASPVTWGGSPSVHRLLFERNPDGSPASCGPSWLVDVELASESPPVSELQHIARFGMVPKAPASDLSFIGVRKQLRDLVHTVPPAPGQGLVDWLLRMPSPDRSSSTPRYLAAGVGDIYSPVTLSLMNVRPDSQTSPADRRDSPESLANNLVVVGDGGSLEDACLFWNLRANRWPQPFPVWVTPDQMEHSEVRRLIVAEAQHTRSVLWTSIGNVNDLQFLSATMDTRELARIFLPEMGAVGWASEDWIHFFDRRRRPFFGRSRRAITFSNGNASFLVDDDELPCPWPTQVTVDVEIESFRPPPTHLRLRGTNAPSTGRFGEAVIPLNYWSKPASSVEVLLGYPKTFDFLRHACEEAGLRPTFDRKAALAYGINRILAGEYEAQMILRNHAVLDVLNVMVDSERLSGETSRRLTPKGTPFGEFHRMLESQRLANVLLAWLLRKSLVFRGLELECRDCGTSVWYSLNDIGDRYQCVGCRQQQPFDRMTHDGPWRYRVNQMLASALDQGVLQEAFGAYDIDLLSSLGSRAYLFPNVILTDKNTGDHVAEIDLLGYEDGEWLAAECKARGNATKLELDRLRRLLDSLGGGSLQLIRASTASEECDREVDRVVIWDYEPIRNELVDTDWLWKCLEPS